jgi:hypothetical protein
MNGSFPAGKPREAGQGFKKAHLLRSPPSSSLNVRAQYASLVGILGALHLTLFEQPKRQDRFAQAAGFRHQASKKTVSFFSLSAS